VISALLVMPWILSGEMKVSVIRPPQVNAANEYSFGAVYC
jgi:hypothetical protein